MHCHRMVAGALLAVCVSGPGPAWSVTQSSADTSAGMREEVTRLGRSIDVLVRDADRLFTDMPVEIRRLQEAQARLHRLSDRPGDRNFDAALDDLDRELHATDRFMATVTPAHTEDRTDESQLRERLLDHWDDVKYQARRIGGGDLGEDREAQADRAVVEKRTTVESARSQESWDSLDRDVQQTTRVESRTTKIQAPAPRPVSIGPVSHTDQDRIISALDRLQRARDDLFVRIETASNPGDRHLWLVELSNVGHQSRKVLVTLDGDHPWWTKGAFDAVSQIQKIHQMTRGQRALFTPDLMEKDRAFSGAVDGLLQALRPVEGDVRFAGTPSQLQFQNRQ